MNSEQIRARDAFAQVGKLAAGERQSFLSIARELPTLLRTNGLLASWAYLLERGTRPEAHILKCLIQHLRPEGIGLLKNTTPGDPKRILFEIWLGQEPLGTLELRQLTSECIHYSGWLKRAAETLCEAEETPPAPGHSGFPQGGDHAP